MTAAIRLEGVGKRYWKLDQQAMLLKSILPFARPKRTELWALRGVELEVAEGETIGVIGRNGAGKTTLLRLLSGVTRPSEGRVTVRGRLAPLISVGVGFHQEMSGRENIYVNGMLLGLTERDVKRQFESIVEFAELGGFIDSPVKFYSSGMLMRLGFAVLVHIRPQVLLIDEVLAVGDSAFQRKCFDQMDILRASGASIVLVSHSLWVIRHLCQRTAVLHGGALVYDGATEQAIARHLALMSGGGSGGPAAFEVLATELCTADGSGHHAGFDEQAHFRLSARSTACVRDLQVVLVINTEVGQLVSLTATTVSGGRPIAAGQVVDVDVAFRTLLGGGTYSVTAELRDATTGEIVARSAEKLLYVSQLPNSLGLAEVCSDFEVRVR